MGGCDEPYRTIVLMHAGKMATLIVQKYGGTSVGSTDRILRVAERVMQTYKEGHRLVVVVSAMGGETDRLVHLAHDLSKRPALREMDMLLSTGEQVTAALLAIALEARDIPVRSFTGQQAGILTDDTHTHARIQSIAVQQLQETLATGIIPIVAGFQGTDAQSNITTLGRGGSDLTAVAIASALHADYCDIYTDVDGVYTADPNIVPAARKIIKISYEAMLEMASLGAKVLQSRSVEFAMKHRVPVRVRSSFHDEEGTWVTTEEPHMEREMVSAITSDKNQAKVTLIGVPDRHGIAARIFNAIAEEHLLVDMIIQNVGQGGLTDLSFTVSKTDALQAKEILMRFSQEMGIHHIEVTPDIAKVSIVGVGMRSHTGVAAKMFECLAGEGINIMMIATSEIKISCVIDAKYTELAVRVLHAGFGLSAEAETVSPQQAV